MALPINIHDLLALRKIESDRIEFKKGWNPDKIYRTIAAFANDFANIGGGYIIIGVEEENGIAKRPVIGLQENQLDNIQKEIQKYNCKLDPEYTPRISVESADGTNVLVLWCPAGNNRPYSVTENVTSKHSLQKWYVRNGSTTIEAQGEILDELRELACRIPFDDRGNPNIKTTDLSPIHIMDYLRKTGSRMLDEMRNRPFERILEDLDLLTGPIEKRLIKNVAAMMFCEHPERFFPYTQVDVVIFPDGRLNNPNNFSEKTFKGPIPQLAYNVLEYLRSIIFQEYVIKLPDRLEALRFFDYPYAAIEEAIINSLYHRDYQDYTPVTIEIEPDNITIYNSGGPDRSISEESIKEGKSMRSRHNRNRRLGDFLKELELTEGRNTGIPTIQRELAANGSPAATFRTDTDRRGLEITIPIHPLAKDKKILRDNSDDHANDHVNDHANDHVNDHVNDYVNLLPNEINILKLISNDSYIKYEDISNKLDISIPTIRRTLRRLKDYNAIIRIGSDKTGHWTVTENGKKILTQNLKRKSL